jgi:hypothetical protein
MFSAFSFQFTVLILLEKVVVDKKLGFQIKYRTKR